MKLSKSYLTTLALVVMLGTSAALAQVGAGARGALGAAQHTGAGSATSGMSVGANGGASGAAQAGANISPQAAPMAGVNAGTRATTDADVSAASRGSSMSDNRSAPASAALDMTNTIQSINSVTVDTRKTLLSEMNERKEAGDRVMENLAKNAQTLRSDAQAEFKAALKDAGAKEKALKQSMKAVKKAKEDNWSEARANLAASHSAYAEAVAHAEAIEAAGMSGKSSG